ncbi:MAG: carbohydrate ABC transporter permease [Planctomycetes bacterium]|nr:carbohydrate ABC transporter permease [Planctomycetota bacterium]
MNVSRRAVNRFPLYISLAAVCALMLLPLVWAFISSIRPLEEVYAFPPRFSVDTPQWSNYQEAVTRLPVLRFMANSLLIATTSVVGAVLTASMAGFVLARIRFRGRGVCFTLVIVSMLVPAQVLLVPRFLLFDLLGWMGTYKPLIVPAWLGGGAFNIFLFRQFFRTIPREMDEAARLEGASTWQIYWHVLLPLARPATVTAALLSFVYHWQEFLDPLIYLSDFTTYTISLGLRMYQSMAGTWANLLMATSLISLIPVAIVFFLGQRYLMRGLGILDGHPNVPPLPRGDTGG